jgi:ATP-dependent helicase HepA
VQNPFIPGQRWLSDAEPDLGLGRVVEAGMRTVRIAFPASGEQRTYAIASAPLSRARLAPDETLQDGAGRSLRVLEAVETGGILAYRCVDAAGATCWLPEAELDDRLRLNRPQDRLLAGRFDADAWFGLRYRSWRQQAALWRSPLYGLQGPRVEPIPHQLYIADEVCGRARARVLLADEVGLGKTIEAGLILHRLLLTERVRRVLVLVPDALLNQWLVEMLRRFNLRFALFDAERLGEEAGPDDDGGPRANPFEAEQRVLCSLAALTESEAAAQTAMEADWDLLVVDEAHHLHWSPEGGDAAYTLVESLAARTPNVLLLTATPEQLGRAGHFGRLRLLDQERFHDYDAFLAGEQAYAPVAELAARLLEGAALGAEQQALLGRLLGDEAALPAAELVERLVDRHGTGRILFRNTRQAIAGFPERRLHAEGLALPDAYAEVAGQPCPEKGFAGDWAAIDPRLPWLRGLLDRLAPEKVLLICAHASTAITLRDHLLERHAIHAALFHERMEIVARDRAAAFFADPESGCPLLICSEIGSEGRNFQFAHHLVLFDLPLDPDLLEQRIGRLDRIGQRSTIELHVPYLEDSAGEVLLRWYRDGLGSFEAVCPSAAAVYEQLADRLAAALAEPALAQSLVDDAAALGARINAELEAGRDRLLELNSCRPTRAARLVEALTEPVGETLLADYMGDYWDAFGVEHESAPGAALVVRPGSHMLHDHFPGLGAEPHTVTFDRGAALAHEDRQFLTWEHPMVRGCLEMLLSGELGGAALTLCSHPGFRTGHALFELLFVTECTAPPGLELQRFLPPSCHRLVIDLHGKDRTAEIDHAALHGVCLSHNRKLAATLVQSLKPRIPALVALAAERAAAASARLLGEALAQMRSELDAEQQRLAALARVNPAIDADEVESVARRREALATEIEAARVRLDAARIVVMR